MNMKIKRFCCLFIAIGLIVTSCEKENNITTILNEETEDNNGGGGGTGGGNNTTLFFRFNSLSGENIGSYEAGSKNIYFESNTEWMVSLDKSHFKASAHVSPTSGCGKGSVTITYGEESDHYDCSDYLYVKFKYVDKVYSNGDKHWVSKDFLITRRYHRTHV